MLAKFDDLILENRQHVRREIQNHYHWMPSLIMEILKDYFVFQLTPLMNMLPEDEDYPDFVWLRKWFTEPEINEEETKCLPLYIVKAAAEALASQCQVLNGFWGEYAGICFQFLKKLLNSIS